MEQVEFTPSAPFTLGVELEFQILDPNSLELVPRAGNLFAQMPEPEKKKIAMEFLQSIFEIQTGICHSIDEVEQDLAHMIRVAEDAAYTGGCFLFASGIHPFSRPERQLVTENERYRNIMAELQYVGRQFISQGLHVHIGMPDGDTTVRICDIIQGYLPLLVALSTSSPYFKGEDTGLASYRTKLFEALPLAGIADYLGCWRIYEEKILKLHRAGIIKEVRDLWWEVRPSPYFGTLEVRVCDMPSSFQDILALTALTQAMAAFLHQHAFAPGRIDPQLLRYNKWQAARHGLNGFFVDPGPLFSGERLAARTAVDRLLLSLEPVMQELGSAKWCGRIQNILDHGTSSDRQRKLVAEYGTYRNMILKLHKEFWI
ncbi:MAG: YbdK family carboxylate-amine ligase [Desulfobulbaceae bacterium]|nr:YbdK family carboxylate-amine ligase [Desulfobulbaceae bacterium]